RAGNRRTVVQRRRCLPPPWSRLTGGLQLCRLVWVGAEGAPVRRGCRGRSGRRAPRGGAVGPGPPQSGIEARARIGQPDVAPGDVLESVVEIVLLVGERVQSRREQGAARERLARVEAVVG